MNLGWKLVLAGILAYLLGSIPWSLLIARWVGGIDLRQHGSGNVGATNVARTLGLKWGLSALVLDGLKGLAAVLLIAPVLRSTEALQTHLQVISAMGAVLGHMFPPWLRFRGGKGMATALGAVVALAPWGCLWALGAFAVLMGCFRIVSLSSIAAVVTFAVAQGVMYGESLWQPSTWSLGLFSIAAPLLIVFQHRGNIVRLWRGEEKPLSFGSRGTEAGGSGGDASGQS